jgi:brefeldin A-resistance guanine nucleotide exchange factor 1
MFQVPVQLLDLMHTLHTRAAQIYQWWASESGEADVASADEEKNATTSFQLGPSLWCRGWCPLLQGIARLCCDARKQVRTTAITYLQRSRLVHDLQSLSASEWESCFNTVLFPLLAKLLEPQRSSATTRAQMQADHSSWEETRIRAATLLSKVFLQHLGPLIQLPTFTALWLTLLDFMDKYMHVENNDLLAEAVPEMMKNLLLVMETAGVFGTNADELDQTSNKTSNTSSPQALQMKTQLWNMTCDRIDVFLPGLRQEITRSKTPIARVQALPLVEDSSLTTIQIPEAEVPELGQEAISLESIPSEQIATDPEPPRPENVLESEKVSLTNPAVDIPEEQTLPGQTTIDDTTNSTAKVSEETGSSSTNFVPSSVFSVWNVPDPSDAAALFFHDLTPAPADDTPAISDTSSILEDELINTLDCHQTPISLIPEDGSDIPVVPLPVFSTAAPVAEENKVADATAEENQVLAIYIFDDFIRFFRNI